MYDGLRMRDAKEALSILREGPIYCSRTKLDVWRNFKIVLFKILDGPVLVASVYDAILK